MPALCFSPSVKSVLFCHQHIMFCLMDLMQNVAMKTIFPSIIIVFMF